MRVAGFGASLLLIAALGACGKRTVADPGGLSNGYESRLTERHDLQWGKPPKVDSVITFLIHGPTGAPYPNMKIHYRTGEFVRVAVTDVNPFLFRYQITHTNQPLPAEASPLEFFQFAFGGLKFPPLETQERLPSLGTGSDSSKCEDAALEVRALMDTTKSLVAGTGRVHQLFDKVEDEARRVDESYAISANVIFGAQQDTREVRASARSASTLLKEHATGLRATLQELRIELRKLDGRIDLFRKQVDDASKRFPACRLDATVLSANATLPADSSQFKRNYSAVASRQSEVAATAANMIAKIDDPVQFYASALLPREDTPKDIDIKITRLRVARISLTDFAAITAGAPSQANTSTQDRGSSQTASGVTVNVITPGTASLGGSGDNGGALGGEARKQVAAPVADLVTEQRLRFGDKGRFSIGAGVAWSPLSAPEFGVAQRPVASRPGAPAGDTLVNVAALTRSASTRMTPMLSLSTALYAYNGPFSSDGVHLTLGVGLRPEVKDLDFEYFIGPGFTFYEQRLMLNPGVYIGPRQRLSGGYQLGDIVPTQSVPTASTLRAHFGFALTYRIR